MGCIHSVDALPIAVCTSSWTDDGGTRPIVVNTATCWVLHPSVADKSKELMAVHIGFPLEMNEPLAGEGMLVLSSINICQ
jgi:hypothetical protein